MVQIVVAGAEPGPAPDTAAFIQRMEEEKKRQERGEVGIFSTQSENFYSHLPHVQVPDNRSFLAKYWMYIVPVVLFMAINGAAAPEGS